MIRPGIQWFHDLLEDNVHKLHQKLGNSSEKVEGHDKHDIKSTTSKATGKERSLSIKRKAIGFALVAGLSFGS